VIGKVVAADLMAVFFFVGGAVASADEPGIGGGSGEWLFARG
jgi:hypothetical protein